MCEARHSDVVDFMGQHVEELGPRLVHRSPASHLCAVTVWVRRHSSSRGRWRASRLTHATLATGRGSTCVDQWSLLLTLMSSSLRLFPGGQHCEGSHAVHIHFLCPARRWRQSVRLHAGPENVCAGVPGSVVQCLRANLSGREATATQRPSSPQCKERIAGFIMRFGRSMDTGSAATEVPLCGQAPRTVLQQTLARCGCRLSKHQAGVSRLALLWVCRSMLVLPCRQGSSVSNSGLLLG